MLQTRMAPAGRDSDTRSAPNPVVSIRALTVTYFTQAVRQALVPALSGIDLDIQQGASIGIFGESGCGKSTLLLSIANLLRSETITRGSVQFRGRNLLTESERALESVRGGQIGLVFQEAATALNPVRTIGDQVIEVLSAHKNMSHSDLQFAAHTALEEVGLDAARAFHAWPHQLSGGQRQRVLIAQALICRPALLLADEPTHALDCDTRTEIANLLRRRTRELNMALVIASHDPEMLRLLTEEMFVFYAGQVIESGPTCEVLERPLHPYTRGLLECFRIQPLFGNDVSVRMKTIPGVPPETNRDTLGCRFVTRCRDRRPVCSELKPALLPVAAPREVRCILYG